MKTKTFDQSTDEYIHFIKVLTDAIRNCPELRAVSVLTGDTIMLSPYHQLTIESMSDRWTTKNFQYKILLNRIVDAGFEYLVVDSGLDRNARPKPVQDALEEFYEELAFYAPQESTVETMDIVDTLEGLMQKYRVYLNTGYSSGFA